MNSQPEYFLYVLHKAPIEPNCTTVLGFGKSGEIANANSFKAIIADEREPKILHSADSASLRRSRVAALTRIPELLMRRY
jgi:hypothetical protein